MGRNRPLMLESCRREANVPDTEIIPQGECPDTEIMPGAEKAPGCFFFCRSLFRGEKEIFDSQKDHPQDSEDDKEDHKTRKSRDHIIQVNISGVGDPLPDLDRERKNHHDREDIDPGYGEHMFFGKNDKQGIDYQKESHSDQSHNRKMQLLVRQKECRGVVELQDLVVYTGDSVYQKI
jgi:hypothetical protein